MMDTKSSNDARSLLIEAEVKRNVGPVDDLVVTL